MALAGALAPVAFAGAQARVALAATLAFIAGLPVHDPRALAGTACTVAMAHPAYTRTLAPAARGGVPAGKAFGIIAAVRLLGLGGGLLDMGEHGVSGFSCRGILSGLVQFGLGPLLEEQGL